MLKIDISIHAPLAGSDREMAYGRSVIIISIHAPLAGSDGFQAFGYLPVGISIHAPLAGSDPPRLAARSLTRYFNPRSPCGERPLRVYSSDSRKPFQSTLPLRGATVVNDRNTLRVAISIHAPLAGSDRPWFSAPSAGRHFNPRSPCGERPTVGGA